MEKRKEVLDDVGGLVFSRQGDPRIPLADAELFTAITTAFQAIIGLQNSRFRFHHLRHSFANWLFLALVGIDNPELAKGWLRLLNSRLLARDSLAHSGGSVFLAFSAHHRPRHARTCIS
ncbi:MAG: hypothetical protein IPL58_16280 [Betaproteobacteria bacterium]|uniref:Uncharacterized protein n=1 Tax=Candidatus Proximibacter danicus TaxID=2954365 RepID=A0A9D7K6C9_9PROT|nr:hypothetical protein [Candidatus Proximibacter danicus]